MILRKLELSESCPPCMLALRAVGFAVLYVAGAELGHVMSFREPFATFWPPSGLFLAVLLLVPYREWSWYIGAAIIGNFATDMLFLRDPPRTLLISIGFTTGNCFEAMVGACLLRRLVADPFRLSNIQQVLGLISIAAILATNCSALIGAATVVSGFGTGAFGQVWLRWWISDVMGILVCTPLFLTWLTKLEKRPSLRLGRLIEAVALFSLLGAVCYVAFATTRESPRPFLIFPLLIWAAMRFERRGAATAAFVTSMFAIWGATHQTGPFASISVDTMIVATSLQAFLATIMLTSLLFATALEERTRADDERKENLELLNAVLLGTTDAIFVKDCVGRYLLINAAGAKFLGKNIEEIIGQDDTALFSPESARAIMAADQRVMQEGKVQTNEDVGMVGNETRNYLSTKGPYRAHDGQVLGLLGISRDVTEYRHALVSSEAEERRFSTLTATAPVGIFETDTAGNVKYVNPRWCELTGLTPALASGTGWSVALHPDDREHVYKVWMGLLAEKGDRLRVEFRFVTPTGVVNWVVGTAVAMRNIEGQTVGYMGSIVDITERMAIEEALRVSEDRFQQMAEAIPEVFFLREAEPFRFLYVSPAYDKLTGRPGTALYSDPLAFLTSIHPDDREKMIQLSMVQHEAPFEDSFKSIRPDGEIRYMRLRVTPIRDAAGKVVRLAGITIDVTELTLIEQALESSNQELERRVNERTAELSATNDKLRSEYSERARIEDRVQQQQLQLAHVARLSTIGQMAAELAHEINQPLYAVRNYLFGVLQSTKLGEPVSEDLLTALQNAETESGRAANIIRRIRNFTRQSEPQRESLALNDLVRNVYRLASADARHRRIEMNIQLAESLPSVLCDPVQIEQVAVNLVRNAFDAIEESGSENRLVVLETSRRGADILFSVHDNGPGFSDELQERVFEPFFTTKHDGLGLGLSISRSIIEAHQGRLWAESRRPHGTSFHFSLPIVQDSHTCHPLPSSTSSTTTLPPSSHSVT